MKHFIQAFAVLLVACGALSLQAQDIKIGGKVGLNLADVGQNYAEEDFESATNMKPSFHVGIVADIGLTDELTVQPGILFSQKGASFDLEENFEGAENVDGYDRLTLNYIEIPINVTYNINDFQIFAGPYVGIGIGGMNKFDYSYEDPLFGSISEEGEISYKPFFGEVKEGDLEEDENAFSALDFGVNLGLGYNVGPVLINAGYSLGLANLTPSYDFEGFDRADLKQTNRVITLSLTYFFTGTE